MKVGFIGPRRLGGGRLHAFRSYSNFITWKLNVQET
jgi:hypothetical protein